jgi:hypothetical protein
MAYYNGKQVLAVVRNVVEEVETNGGADALLDGTAFADGTYTNNTVKSLRMGCFRNTRIKTLLCAEVEEIKGNLFANNDEHTLEYIYFPKLRKISGTQAFVLNSNLTGDWGFLPQLEVIAPQVFRGCQIPESIIFSELTTVNFGVGSPFDATQVKHLVFPKLQTGTFNNFCGSAITALQTVEFGSVGYPVVNIHATAFNGSTSITSITVYCEDPNNPPTGSPWGATNATVTFLKA